MAQLWREPAGRSILWCQKLWMCDCRLWIDEWSVRASDQSRTNAVVIVTACLRREWSRTGNSSVQRHEWLDMLKLPIWRRCAQEYAANEGSWTLGINSCSSSLLSAGARVSLESPLNSTQVLMPVQTARRTVRFRVYPDNSNTCKVMPCSHYVWQHAVPQSAGRINWKCLDNVHSCIRNSPCKDIRFRTDPMFLHRSGHLRTFVNTLQIRTHVSAYICNVVRYGTVPCSIMQTCVADMHSIMHCLNAPLTPHFVA